MNLLTIPSFCNNHNHIPQKNNLIITVGCGRDYEKQLDITEPLMRAYAEKCNADFVALRENKFPQWGIGNKYQVHPYLEQYEQTLFVDADLIITDNAPNIFAECSSSKLWVHNEYHVVYEIHPTDDWIQTECDEIAKSQFLPLINITSMYNAGMFLMPRQFQYIYRVPDHPIPEYWCSEQHLFTLRLLHSRIPIGYLNENWHLSFLNRRFWEKAPNAYFIHVNGSRPNSYRLELLQRFAEKNYSKFDPKSRPAFLPNWLKK